MMNYKSDLPSISNKLNLNTEYKFKVLLKLVIKAMLIQMHDRIS